MRMWTVENTTSADSNTMNLTYPMPYRRTGPGSARDGQLKFDLSQFDPAYFNRLRHRVSAAGQRGIYVMIMLFNGWGIDTKGGQASNRWPFHPFNKDNNVNGINGDVNGDGEGTEAHTLANPAVTAVQKAYIRRVIDTVNDLDNVLYEISNEDTQSQANTDWQYDLIGYIKSYEATKPKQHPVVMTAQYPSSTSNSILFASQADATSPAGWGDLNGSDYQNNPPAADERKVIIADSDHISAGRKDPEFVWKQFLRGNNPIVLDDRGGNADWWISPDPAWEPIRRAMGDTRRYADKTNLAAITPRGDLASTGYALANRGSEYLVYQSGSGEFTVDLVAGSYSIEWFNPKTGTEVGSGTITASDGFTLFTPPFGGEAVLYLKRADGGGEGELCLEPSPMPPGWALPCPVLVASTEPGPSSGPLTISAGPSTSK